MNAPGAHWVTWTAEGIRMHTPTTFLCIRFLTTPSEETTLKMQRSPFMYGFFSGVACWHAVKTPELEQFLRDL